MNTVKNPEWAIKELDDFLKATSVVPSSSTPNSYHRAEPESKIVGRAQVVEKILDRVVPTWRTDIPKEDRNEWSAHRTAAIRAKVELVRAEEVKQNLGENAPDLSAAELHDWIWSGAKSLWQSGHYREAVGGAIKKLNAETQNKVGRRDVSETDLFKQSYSMDAPEPGKSRLRRMEDDGSNTYKSVQRGAMNLAEGVFAGIRNPLIHEADQELTEQEALEYLAVLSVLARWVDNSSLEESL